MLLNVLFIFPEMVQRNVPFAVALIGLGTVWQAAVGTSLVLITVAVLFAILIVIAAALTIGDRSGWGFLFSYSAACAALVVPSAYSFVGVLGCTALAAICCSLGGGSAAASFGYGASAIGVGLLMTVSQAATFACLVVLMACLGMGNGSVFQMVPQRFRKEIGVMTGLVGAAGGHLPARMFICESAP